MNLSTTDRRPSRWLAFACLTVALLAVGIAISSWFRPTAETKHAVTLAPPNYSEQQIAEAKTKSCEAYHKVHKAVLVNTGRSGGNDPIALLGVAANARIALYDGGDYLKRTLAEQPATPPDLADAIRQLASAYQQLAINYMAEANDSEIDSSLHAGDKPNATISEICK